MEGKEVGRGEKPKVGLAEGLPGAPPLLPESVPALSHPPRNPTDPVMTVPMGREERWPLAIFFLFFFFLVIKIFLV